MQLISELTSRELRESVVKNYYRMATVKWTPKKEFVEFSKTVLEGKRKPFSVYKTGEVYYGVPFTRGNKANLSEFLKVLDGQQMFFNTVRMIPGADCTSSIICSMPKNVEIPIRYISHHIIWDRSVSYVLGDLDIGTECMYTDKLSEKFVADDLYEAYSLLRIGDVLCSHYFKPDGQFIEHTRLISGVTKTVRDNGMIDAQKSYVIISENFAKMADMTVKNNFGGELSASDYTVPYVADRFTDILKLSDFEGKNTNFRINRKIKFESLWKNYYFPLSFNFYKNYKLY